MKIHGALKALAQLELSIAKLYEYYCETLEDDPDAALLFSRMAREEHRHLQVVDYQRRLVRANPLLFNDIDLDLAEAERTTIEAQAMTVASHPPTLDEAIGAALRIETNAAESHYRSALASANEEIAAFLENLARGDREHLGRLMEFAKKRALSEVSPALPTPSTPGR